MNKLGRTKTVVYGLVLAAGLIGLVIDRLARAPVTPVADENPPMVSPSRPRPLAVPAALSPAAGPLVARIFELAESAADVPRPGRGKPRDAFTMTPDMRDHYETGEKEDQAKQKQEDEQQLLRRQLEEFQSTHHLKGTTLAGDQSWALIDQRVLRVGDRLDGFELQRIERYRVVFVRGEINIALALPLP